MKPLPKTIHPSSVEWIRKGMNATDREKSAWAAMKVRRYIDCAELLRTRRTWMVIGEIQEVLGVSRRLANRTLHHLEAAGVIEVLWQRGG